MTLTEDVLDVETVARPADTRAAISYLVCSGAVAITIIENVKGCAFKVGTKISARAAVVMWLREDEATAVMRKARKLAGRSPDLTKATSALTKAASDQRVTLTEHAVAMMRAGEAAKRLDAFIAQLRSRGADARIHQDVQETADRGGTARRRFHELPSRRGEIAQGARAAAPGRRQRPDAIAVRRNIRAPTRRGHSGPCRSVECWHGNRMPEKMLIAKSSDYELGNLLRIANAALTDLDDLLGDRLR